jgi:redox-sensitive bicupin YhaK (pirin superfamily)
MPPESLVETVIVPRSTDLGGFEVKRVLPSSRRRMVGPFIFLDQMGPTDFEADTGVDVRPHPHIGLSTVTWLLDGEIMHRDSVGSIQNIRPGEVNWMTAGSGIAHSERTPDALRPGGSRLYALQTWLALPQPFEEAEPFFEHFGDDALPKIDGDGLTATLIAGSGWGKQSPVQVFSETIYADVQIAGGSALPIPPEHEERAVYVLEGTVAVAGEDYEAGSLMVFKPGIGSMFRHPPMRGLWFWAVRQRTVRVISGGISCRAGPNGSSRRNVIGRRKGLPKLSMTMSSFHCRRTDRARRQPIRSGWREQQCRS